jgi:hypothetical protein
MCDDIHATVAELERKGAEISRPIGEEPWGLVTAIRLPDGGELGLHEPRHPSPARSGPLKPPVPVRPAEAAGAGPAR